MLTTTAVSPVTIKNFLNFNNTVLLAMYVPTLPKWRNFSSVLEDVHEHFRAQPSLNVHVVRADCSAFPVQTPFRALLCAPMCPQAPCVLTGQPRDMILTDFQEALRHSRVPDPGPVPSWPEHADVHVHPVPR